jgi:hypothetical protein
MKGSWIISCALGFGLLVGATTAMAHHGFYGVFDLTNPITFEGVVTSVDWANPHISFTVDVKDQDGKVTNWRFEGAGPGALRTRGWVRTDLKNGETVKLVGYRATNGSFVAAAGAVTLVDGRTLDAGSDGVQPLKGTLKTK